MRTDKLVSSIYDLYGTVRRLVGAHLTAGICGRNYSYIGNDGRLHVAGIIEDVRFEVREGRLLDTFGRIVDVIRPDYIVADSYTIVRRCDFSGVGLTIGGNYILVQDSYITNT